MEEIERMKRWSEAWLVVRITIFVTVLYYLAKVISHTCHL